MTADMPNPSHTDRVRKNALSLAIAVGRAVTGYVSFSCSIHCLRTSDAMHSRDT